MGTAVEHRARRALLLLALGATLASASRDAAAEAVLDAQGALSRDSNLSRALSSADIVGDSALNLAASGGYRFVLGGRDGLTLTGDLRASQFRNFHGMNNVAAGATASWRRKFGVGALVPWLSLSASFAREAYGESIRNGERASVTLRVGKRLSERLQLSAGGGLDRYRANSAVELVPGVSGDAFSLEGRSVFGRADYSLSETWLAFLRFGARRGDVTASTRPDPEILEYASAVAPDPAFGDDYVAYRLTGTTWDFSAGASLAVSDRYSLNFTLTRDLTYATGGLDYRDTQVNASIIFGY